MPVKVQVSDQQIQIVDLISEGFIVKDIATQMKITKKTVETHLYNLRKKMNAKNLPHLVKIFSSFGLLNKAFSLNRESASQLLEAYREDLVEAGSLNKNAMASEDWFESYFPTSIKTA